MSEDLNPIEERNDTAPLDESGTADVGDEGEKKPSKWRGSQVLIGLIGLGLAGTYFMYLKTGPQKAAASQQQQAMAANKQVNEFLNSGPSNVKSMEKMLRNTEKVIQQFLAYPAVTQVALSDLKTNPFRQSSDTKKLERVDEALAAKQKEAERQAALTAVRGLNLQSVLVSDRNRSCMINNALYLEGQQVDQFNIERIASDSVVVRRGAYRFELHMNR
jgi:hypothetical protein